jgi:hypothetical protein
MVVASVDKAPLLLCMAESHYYHRLPLSPADISHCIAVTASKPSQVNQLGVKVTDLAIGLSKHRTACFLQRFKVSPLWMVGNALTELSVWQCFDIALTPDVVIPDCCDPHPTTYGSTKQIDITILSRDNGTNFRSHGRKS